MSAIGAVNNNRPQVAGSGAADLIAALLDGQNSPSVDAGGGGGGPAAAGGCSSCKGGCKGGKCGKGCKCGCGGRGCKCCGK